MSKKRGETGYSAPLLRGLIKGWKMFLINISSGGVDHIREGWKRI